MNFDPNDLHGILPALILSLGALVLLTSEVFLHGVRPAMLGASTGPAEEAHGLFGSLTAVRNGGLVK